MSRILFSDRLTGNYDCSQVVFVLQPYFLSLLVCTARASVWRVVKEQHHPKNTFYSSEWIQWLQWYINEQFLQCPVILIILPLWSSVGIWATPQWQIKKNKKVTSLANGKYMLTQPGACDMTGSKQRVHPLIPVCCVPSAAPSEQCSWPNWNKDTLWK